VIGLVGQVHLHQHVAGKELAFRVDLAAAPDLDDLLLRHQHFVEQVREAALLRLLADRVRDLVLEIRVGVDDVPALGLGCRDRVRHLISPWKLTADAEHQRDQHADDLIRDEKEHRSKRREDENHRGGDSGFLARGPGDLVGLLTHFLHELERV